VCFRVALMRGRSRDCFARKAGRSTRNRCDAERQSLRVLGRAYFGGICELSFLPGCVPEGEDSDGVDGDVVSCVDGFVV
jgi:hypothetical protein